MVLWQFLVLTVFFVAVLVTAGVYARLLSRTIGHANARLKRIEEALTVANDRLLRRTVPEAAEPSHAIVHKSDRADYLTIRDLKADGRRPHSQATYSSSRRSRLGY